ncbi:DUF72 domain-containing protein [Ignicoccus islandicus]|uniref:DUF72 domain-containing protein n=1 Tax=Ignicoccus islandicus TaxID=54259 RepID=UPI0012ED687F|nr:DUF72 domain-containing protein [Ignicoccus islandicus]
MYYSGNTDLMIYYGTCGFPKSKRVLREYINAVEIQQTFYNPPPLETLEKWRRELGDEINVHLKAWQLVSHPPTSPTYRRAKIVIPKDKLDRYGLLKLTEEVKEAWLKTVEAARAVKGDVIVVQTPPSFGYSKENLERAKNFFRWALTTWKRIGWEPRGTWVGRPEVREIVDMGIIHIVDPFKQWPPYYEDIIYLRLHGKGSYRYEYSEEELKDLIERIMETNASEVHVMFNNVYMMRDVVKFKRLLEERFKA